MKRVLAAGILLVMCLTLVSCGGPSTIAEETPDTQNVTQQQNNIEDISDAKQEDESIPPEEIISREEYQSVERKDDGKMRKDLDALTLQGLMGNGINLGNVMESYSRSELGASASVMDIETFWGSQIITPKMLEGMKKSGFDTLRIPVSWTNTMHFEDGDYTISTEYMDRVQMLVDYARACNMYVIINDHWDGGWWGMFGSKNDATRQKAIDMYTSMWQQIASRFRDYSDYVIFESGNEELGDRFNDKDIAVDTGDLSEDECYELTALVNQTFVDTVRKSGKNNKKRFLLIAGYNANIEKTCDKRFVIPEDTIENRLLVSVHYYEPAGYTLANSRSTWGSRKDYEQMSQALEQMKQFTEQGIGVVIGEYGAIPSGKSIKDNTLEYTKSLLNNCDIYEYAPILWDTGILYDRATSTLTIDALRSLFKEHSYTLTQIDKDLASIKSDARQELDEMILNSPQEEEVSPNKAYAALMFSSTDGKQCYCLSDEYLPGDKSYGLITSDVEINGGGTYTVSLDFSDTELGYAKGIGMAVLSIYNGEVLYPKYLATIEKVWVNGWPIKLSSSSFTYSVDEKNTRVSLYNPAIKTMPENARYEEGANMPSANLIPGGDDSGKIREIKIQFTYSWAK